MLLKLLFVFLVAIHALIHVRGFFIAIHYREEPARFIPSIVAILWILTSVSLAIAAILVLLKAGSWPLLLLFTAFISQILIITQWKEAKTGTIVNLILLCVAIPAFANTRFQNNVDKEVAQLLGEQQVDQIKDKRDTVPLNLPLIVQKWLSGSQPMQLNEVHYAHIQQRGKMRLRPNGKWMQFEAEEFITTGHPSFLWNSSVQMFPLLYFNGRDKFQNGEGEMLIKGLSLVNVVNERSGEQINTGSLLRYLGEICWAPSAALQPSITWESIDSLHARAIVSYNSNKASGIFQFNEAGDIAGFCAERFYKRDNGYTKEKWQVNIKEYKVFQGVKVPSRCEIVWRLAEGNFKWMVVEITGIDYISSSSINTTYDK